MTTKTAKTATKTTTKGKAEDKPQPTTGPRSGKVTKRKPNPKDNGHTMIELVGPYATKSGKFEVTWTCECGKTLRPYVAAAGDVETARKSHARHVQREAAPMDLSKGATPDA